MLTKKVILLRTIKGIKAQLLPGVAISKSNNGILVASIRAKKCAFVELNSYLSPFNCVVFMQDNVITIKGPDFSYSFHKNYLYLFEQKVNSI